jgi:ubiquinone biosynthesis protein UbiJ
MSDSPPAPGSVPTLTEVVRPAPGSVAAAAARHLASSGPLAIDQAAIVAQVLAALQAQIEPALDARLRAALAPALARAAEQVVHEARRELARSLQAWVADAVAQELMRLRPAAADGHAGP